MFQHLIVPIDGSPASWSAVPVATRLAAASHAKVDVVTVVDRLADIALARRELEEGIVDLGLDTEPMPHVLANDDVALGIAHHVESFPGSMIVMSSHGRGRSAAVLGSVPDSLLRLVDGPLVLVGPHVDVERAGRVDGAYLVPLDGSETSEQILPLVSEWAVAFGGVPWIVEVIGPAVRVTGDVFESAYPARLAGRLHAMTGQEVDYDVLHGDTPSRSVVDAAERLDASFIMATTHGRTGLGRLRLGSVAAEMVRHAVCPVVVLRPEATAD